MKIKLVVIGLLTLTLLGSCDCKKQLNEIKSLQSKLFPVPDDIEDQESVSLNDFPNRTDSFQRRFDVWGEIKKEYVHINIPVPDKSLKIVNYVNISTTNTNALLIILDGNKGLPVKDLPESKVIKKKFKISKLGFKNSLEKLMVIVLHDNNFNANHVAGYQRRIIKHPGYENFESCLMKNWDIGKYTQKDDDVEQIFKPDEDGGDIIP